MSSQHDIEQAALCDSFVKEIGEHLCNTVEEELTSPHLNWWLS